jgi:ABC-type Fe3+-hydroxamate transport system substrate-binding protein
VPDLIAHAGGRPVLVAPGDPDRIVSLAELAAAAPDVLVVLGEAEDDATRPVPGAHVHRATPSLYLRPGPNLIEAAEALADLLYPPPPAEPEGNPRR